MMNLKLRPALIGFLTCMMVTGVPLSCTDDCEGGESYGIMAYQFDVVATYTDTLGFTRSEVKDSLHISEFGLVLSVPEFTNLSALRFERSVFQFLPNAYACDPRYRHENYIGQYKITSSDTLKVNRQVYEPGKDLSLLFTPSFIPFDAFDNFNESLRFLLRTIPNESFETSFKITLTLVDDSNTTLDYETARVKVSY